MSEELKKYLDRDGRLASELRDLIEGMSVSIDVSTGDHDSGNRLFGVVNEVMDDSYDKCGVTLLVYDAKPNFTPAEQPSPASTGRDAEEDFKDWVRRRGPLGVGASPERIFFAGHSYGSRSAPVAARELDVEAERRLLIEARAVLETWKDTVPAVSLCADIDKVLAARSAAQGTAPAPVTDPVKKIVTGVREFYLGILSRHLPPEAFDQARAEDATRVAYDGVAELFVALLESDAAQGAQPESAPVSTEQAVDAHKCTTTGVDGQKTVEVSTEQAGDAPKKELAHGHREDFYLMANARRIGQEPISRVVRMPNWSLAAELFATGSNSARQICLDAGIDPAGYTVERAPSPNNSPVGAAKSGD